MKPVSVRSVGRFVAGSNRGDALDVAYPPASDSGQRSRVTAFRHRVVLLSSSTALIASVSNMRRDRYRAEANGVTSNNSGCRRFAGLEDAGGGRLELPRPRRVFASTTAASTRDPSAPPCAVRTFRSVRTEILRAPARLLSFLGPPDTIGHLSEIVDLPGQRPRRLRAPRSAPPCGKSRARPRRRLHRGAQSQTTPD